MAFPGFLGGPRGRIPVAWIGRSRNSAGVVLAMLETGLVQLSFDCNDHIPQLTALADRYADRHPDLADLCIIRMSELLPRHSVITVDRNDFRVYRRNRREAIPVICPPVA